MVELVAGRIDDADAAVLIAALLEDLAERYGGRDAFHPDPESLAPPAGVFVLARLDGVAVGCGGFRRFADGVAEIKRMYVVPEARRRGVATALLADLETRALGRSATAASAWRPAPTSPRPWRCTNGPGTGR